MGPETPNTQTPQRRERSLYWNNACVPGVEFFKATFYRHSYVRHTHDAYAIGAIEAGVQTFYYRGSQHVTPPHGLIAVNPDEAHDGRAYQPTGYRYRMIYVEPEVFRDLLRDLAPRFGGLPFFPQAVMNDPALAERYFAMHRAVDDAVEPGGCPMEQQSRLLGFLADLAVRHGENRPQPTPPRQDERRVRRAIEFMRAGLDRKLTLDEVAREVGLSRYYFLRLFRSATGLPPHAYLCQLRLEAARTLMFEGCPLAQAAIQTGFFDQSHFTGRFRRTYGVSPGEYVRSIRGELPSIQMKRA